MKSFTLSYRFTFLFIYLLFISVSSRVFSQSLDVFFEDWDVSEGSCDEFIDNVITVADVYGNVYVSSSNQDSITGHFNILVSKYSRVGSLLWSDEYNVDTTGNMINGDIILDNAGNLIITGAGHNNSNDYDLFVLKYENDGTFLWIQKYNGTANGYDGGISLSCDENNDIYVAGGTTQTETSVDFVTLKYSDTGTLLWSYIYDYGNLIDVAIDIRLNEDEVVVGGSIQKTSNYYGVCTMRYDTTDGSFISEFNTADSLIQIDQVVDIEKDGNGNIFIAGTQNNVQTGKDFLLIKLDDTLGIKWDTTYNSFGTIDDVAKGMVIDSDGSIIITGLSKNQSKDVLTVKFSNSGIILWSEVYDSPFSGDDEGRDIVADSGNNIYVTGWGAFHGNDDYLTLCYDENGTENWVKNYNGIYNNDDRANKISLDNDENLIVSGQSFQNDTFRYVIVKYVKQEIVVPNCDTIGNNIWYVKNNDQLKNTEGDEVPDVEYYLEHKRFNQYYLDDRISFVQSRIYQDSSTLDSFYVVVDSVHRVDMTFYREPIEASSINPEIYSLAVGQNYRNFYYGHIPEGRTRVPVYNRLIHKNIFDKVDLLYSNSKNSPHYYVTALPGSDPSEIKFLFNGQDSIFLTSTGEIEIYNPLDTIIFEAPKVYQLDQNGDIESLGWSSKYVLNDSIVSFYVETYDTSKVLVFEISNFSENSISALFELWSTCFGGSSRDYSVAADIDASGKYIAVFGNTQSVDFPVLDGLNQVYAENSDGFVAKFNSNGVQQWTTYYGGSNHCNDQYCSSHDKVHDGVIDKNDNLIFVGYSSSRDFPLKNDGVGHYDGSYQDGNEWYCRNFIIKLDQEGALLWGTHFGDKNANIEEVTAIGTNPISGNFVIGGFITSSDIIEGNPFPEFDYMTPTGSYYSNVGINFIAEFDESNELLWSTLFNNYYTPETGPPIIDSYITDIVYDPASDHIAVTGRSQYDVEFTSAFEFFDPGNNAYVQSSSGDESGDAFISEFDEERDLIWSTLFGGNGRDSGSGIDFTSEGEIFISGSTASSDLDVKSYTANPTAYFEDELQGAQDIFIAGFDGDRKQLWTTYFGGNGRDSQPVGTWGLEPSFDDIGGGALAIDSDDNLFVTGFTNSSNLPTNTTTTAYESYYYPNINKGAAEDNSDAFLLVFKPNLDKQFCTYWGGYSSGLGVNQGEKALGIATYQNEFLVFVGITGSTGPQVPLDKLFEDSYLESYSGGFDAFISKLSISALTEGEVLSNSEKDITPIRILVFPNPSENSIINFSIESPNFSFNELRIKATSIAGQDVKTYEYDVMGGNGMYFGQIDLTEVIGGVYFLTFFVDDQYLITKKIILIK